MNEAFEVRADLAWALLAAGLVVVLGTLLWMFLNAHVYELTSLASSASSSTRVDESVGHLETIWRLWPLWFGGGVSLYLLNRAVLESKYR